MAAAHGKNVCLAGSVGPLGIGDYPTGVPVLRCDPTEPATVGKHLERIYPKLGVENRTAAISFASELNGETR